MKFDAHRTPVHTAAPFLLMLTLAAPAAAQGDGPRSQVMFPPGMNFFVPTYLRLSGDFDFTQSILLDDADVDSDVFVITYFRAFGLGGRYAQIWINPIFGRIEGTATVVNPGTGQRISGSTSTSGLGDPVFSFKLGLIGMPALTLPEFAKYRQTFQLSGFISVVPPLGSYDSDRLLNLGTNRWAVRAGVPMVVPFGNPRTTFLEVFPSVTIYTDNDDPGGGASLKEQAPLFQLENHLSHNFTPKLWGSLDLRYFGGGETTTDGIEDDNVINQVGGGFSVGFALSSAVSVQGTYGRRFTSGENKELQMLRLKVAYVF